MQSGDLLSLRWPAPPRNIFVVKKDCAPEVTASLVELAKSVDRPYAADYMC